MAIPTRWSSTTPMAPWRSIPGSSSTTTARIQISCGCSASSAWRPATRTCRSRCRAGGPASSTAAAAPTGSSRSGGTWSGRRTCRLLARDRALQSRGAGTARCARCGTPDTRRVPGVAPVRRGVHDRYLFPMASAIWSASLDAIRSFPAVTLIRFFDNHGLLSLMRSRRGRSWPAAATPTFQAHGEAVGRHPQGASIQAVRRSEPRSR